MVHLIPCVQKCSQKSWRGIKVESLVVGFTTAKVASVKCITVCFKHSSTVEF